MHDTRSGGHPAVNDDYPLLGVIADGAGGVVYLSRNSTGDAVALKLPSEETFSTKTIGTRAREEFLGLLALEHPNLNPIIDYGRIKRASGFENSPFKKPEPGATFLVSPYVSGGNLNDLVARKLAENPGSDELDRWLSGVTLQVLNVLSFLHDRSYLHYDIKPENLLASADLEFASGIPMMRVIDLGLAARETTPLGTRVRGSYPFIAPEVMDRSLVDQRVDLYSLGASLYHALTGGLKAQYLGSEETARNADRLAAPQNMVPQLPEFWNDCILRLLEKDPEHRHSSALLLIEEILRRPATRDFSAPDAPMNLAPKPVGNEKEHDYLSRELEKLEIGELASSMLILGGPSGVGKGAMVERLIDLSRLQGMEIFRVRCRGAGDAPLDPLLRLFEQIHRHPASSESTRQELQFLTRFIRDGRQPKGGELPELTRREESRIRLLNMISRAFVELDSSDAYLFVVESLHLASPELIECLGLIARRINLRHAANDPSARAGRVGSNSPPTVEAVRTLIIATSDSPEERPAPVKIIGRCLSISDLALNDYVSRISLKPRTVAQTKNLTREVLGPCHLTASIYNELHELTSGHWAETIRLLVDASRFGYLKREPHGWVWDEGRGPTARGILRKIDGELKELPVAGRQLLALLNCSDGTLPAREIEGACKMLGVSGFEEKIGALIAAGWVAKCICDPGIAGFARVRASETEPEHLTDALRARSRWQLQERPENPLVPVALMLALHDGEELCATLPRALEVLRDLHCDSSIVRLTRTLRTLSDIELNAEWLLAEAEAQESLGARDLALETLSSPELASAPEPLALATLLLSGKIHREEREFSLARRCFEEALLVTRENLDREREVAILIEMTRLFLDRSSPDKAAETAELADDLVHGPSRSLETVFAPELRARTRAALADVHTARNAPQKAIRVLHEFLEKNEDSLPPAWLARLSGQIAKINFENAHYDDAFEYWQRSLPLERELGNVRAMAEIESQIGRIYYNRGETEPALSNYLKSLDIREEIDDRHGIAVCCNNLGLIYTNQNQLDAAEDNFQLSLRVFDELDIPEKQAVVLNNLSDCMLVKGRYQEGLRYAQRGLDKRKAMTNQSGMAFSYFRIAGIYSSQGELDRAVDYAEKSLEIRRELGDTWNIANSLQQIGQFHRMRGQYYEAYRALRQALGNYEAVGGQGARISVFGELGVLYQILGNYEESRVYFDQAIQIGRDVQFEYQSATDLWRRASLFVETGALSNAETDLRDAERFFRRGPIRRDLAELLLVKTRLFMELGNRERAHTTLAEQYSYVEQLGLLDLYPPYYYLRGLLILDGGEDSELPVAQRLFERGLEEAERLGLQEQVWQFQFALYKLGLRTGHREGIRRRLRAAHEALSRLRSRVPSQFQNGYMETALRAELLAAVEEEELASNEDSEASRATTEPTPEPVAEPDGDQLPTYSADDARLHEVMLLLTSERDLKVLLDRIMDEVLDLFQAERGYLILTDADGNHRIEAARNIDKEEVDRPDFEYSRSIAREVINTGEIFLTNDARNDERLRDAASVHDLRLQAISCFPLAWRGEQLGLIYLENRFRKRLVEPERMRLLQAFANQAAVAITNARLHQENAERQRELESSKQRIEELNNQLSVRVEKQSRELEVAKREIQLTKDQLVGRYQFDNIIGRSDAMRDLYAKLDKVSKTDLPVLIEGASGTGKELVAHAIHYNSARRDHAFLRENCGAIPETLFESEFFGHVKGAFTGADRDRKGLFELANEGTLFLDEIHELSFEMQKKLLRVLQDGEYRPVGGKKTQVANVRVVVASNIPLFQLVHEGKFREDLYYRLNVLKLELPALKDRGGDVLLLARHFLKEVSEKESLGEKRFSRESLRRLALYPYPGNVRELQNVVEKAAILSSGKIIEPTSLYFDTIREDSSAVTKSELGALVGLPLKAAKDEFQRSYLQSLLDANDRVVARAARQSGITRESFHRLMKKHGIRRD